MKKILLMAVVICLAAMTALFTSCKKEQKSSYQYVVALDDSVEQDPQMSMQFELYALPVIEAEMKKSADQSGSTIIFKDTKSKADSVGYFPFFILSLHRISKKQPLCPKQKSSKS